MFTFLTILCGSFKNHVGTPFLYQYGTRKENNAAWISKPSIFFKNCESGGFESERSKRKKNRKQRIFRIHESEKQTTPAGYDLWLGSYFSQLSWQIHCWQQRQRFTVVMHQEPRTRVQSISYLCRTLTKASLLAKNPALLAFKVSRCIHLYGRLIQHNIAVSPRQLLWKSLQMHLVNQIGGMKRSLRSCSKMPEKSFP